MLNSDTSVPPSVGIVEASLRCRMYIPNLFMLKESWENENVFCECDPLPWKYMESD